LSVGPSVCLSVTIASNVVARTVELIEMPLGMWTRVGPRKHCEGCAQELESQT